MLYFNGQRLKNSLPTISRYEVEYDEQRLTIAHDIGSRFLDIDIPVFEYMNNGNSNRTTINTNANTVDCEDDAEQLLLEQQQQITSVDVETSITTTPTTATTTNPVETELCNNTTANATTATATTTTSSNSCSTNHKNFQHHNGDDPGESSEVAYNDGGGGDEGDGGGGSRDGEKVKNCLDPITMVPQLNGNSTNASKMPMSSNEFVLDILNDDLISRVRSKITNGNKELFEPCVKAVKAFLAGEPFQEFETSMYFHR